MLVKRPWERAMPEQIDFYVLSNAPSNGKQEFACRLCEKAFLNHHHVVIHAASHEEAVVLDELLWTFKPGSFIPHALRQVAQDEPIVIGHREQPAGGSDVLIQLADDIPESTGGFTRVAEIVTDSNRDVSRQHYRQYEQAGYQINTHKLQF